MDKKRMKSLTASDDDAKTKKNKKSSTSTDAEKAHVSSSKSFKNGKGKLKKKKIHKEEYEEIKELTKSIKELTEAINKQQENLLTKADLLEVVSLKEKDKYPSCCFECEEAEGNNEKTIFVGGIKFLGDRDEIKKVLRTIFADCGEMERIHVPYECETGVPLGFAFINMKDGKGNDELLEFNGSFMEGNKLLVTLAKSREEYYYYTNFSGCESCRNRPCSCCSFQMR